MKKKNENRKSTIILSIILGIFVLSVIAVDFFTGVIGFVTNNDGITREEFVERCTIPVLNNNGIYSVANLQNPCNNIYTNALACLVGGSPVYYYQVSDTNWENSQDDIRNTKEVITHDEFVTRCETEQDDRVGVIKFVSDTNEEYCSCNWVQPFSAGYTYYYDDVKFYDWTGCAEFDVDLKCQVVE